MAWQALFADAHVSDRARQPHSMHCKRMLGNYYRHMAMGGKARKRKTTATRNMGYNYIPNTLTEKQTTARIDVKQQAPRDSEASGIWDESHGSASQHQWRLDHPERCFWP